MDKVILLGYFNETIELCEKCGCSIIGYVDQADKCAPYTYLGDDEAFISNYANYKTVPLVITPDNPYVRERLYFRYHELGFKFKTIIAPDAIVSNSALISEGCIIQSQCFVSASTFLGKCVRINVGAKIMHDVHINHFSVIAPCAVVLGYVFIDNKVYIGSNSTVLPKRSIGKESMVGAGAVVTKDVPCGIVVVGIPARILKKERVLE